MEITGFKVTLWSICGHWLSTPYYCTTFVFDGLDGCLRQISFLLCVYPSATEFSAILFLLPARSSSNSPRLFRRLRRTLVLNFIQIRQRVKNFPIDPNCKNRTLSATLKRCRKRAVFTMGSLGKLFICRQIQLKFRLRVRLKRWNDWGEYELDRSKSKNNIAENSVAVGHDTHNRLSWLQKSELGNIFFLSYCRVHKVHTWNCILWKNMGVRFCFIFFECLDLPTSFQIKHRSEKSNKNQFTAP